MRSLSWRGVPALLSFVLALVGLGQAAEAQSRKAILSFAALGINQSFAFVAEDEGFWKQEGLDVELLEITGPPSILAVATGDAQFGQPSGPTFLQLRSTGQDLIAIVDVMNAVPNEIVLRKDVADKTGLTVAGNSAQKRAQALKGLNISDDGSGSGPDVYLHYIAHLGGLDPEKDLGIVTVPPNAAIAAMESGRIDGFSELSPWSTLAVQKGTGVLWLSGLRGDIPGLSPVENNLIATRRDYCEKNPENCVAMAKGVRHALQFIQANPEKSLADVLAHLKNMDPAAVKSGFSDVARMMSHDGLTSDAAFKNIQDYAIAGGSLKPSQAAPKFEGVVYTNKYLQ